MAAVNGTLYAVFATVGTVATATAATDRICSCKSASLNINTATPDASTKESLGWWEGIAGQKDWSIDFGGVWDEALSATKLSLAEIMVLVNAGSAAMKFSFIPAIMGVGTPGWMGMGFFTNVKISGDMEVPCEFSGSVKGTGPLALFTA